MSVKSRLFASVSAVAMGLGLCPANAQAACGSGAGAVISAACTGPFTWTGGGLDLTSSGLIELGANGVGVGVGVSTGTLTNDGTVSGMTAGLANSLGNIDTIFNRGRISGNSAVANSGTIGRLSNSGEIAATSTGLLNAGTINLLTNSGRISASMGIMGLSGTIVTFDNTSSGTINGGVTALLHAGGSIGSLTNSGVISGGAMGILIDSGMISTIINDSGATISGSTVSGVYNAGIYSSSGNIGTLTNRGVVSGSASGFAQSLAHISELNNDSGGTISGDSYGVLNSSSTITTFANASGGHVSGGRRGISNSGGVIEQLTNDGAITGGTTGLRNSSAGTIGTLSNSGEISGGTVGILNISGTIRTIINANTGTITATASNEAYGIRNFGSIGRIDNYGAINVTSAATRYAIRNAGTIETIHNDTGSTIDGIENDVGGMIGPGTIGITNDGNITTLVNHGTIAGAVNGYEGNTSSALGSLLNTGLITASGTTADAAVYLDHGSIGTITNSGTILGDADANGGFYNDVGTIGTIRNSGTISNSWSGLVNVGGTITAIDNSGLIESTAATNANCGLCNALTEIGRIANTGTISSSKYGVANYNGTFGRFDNDGLISGGIAGYHSTGGTLTAFSNNVSGTITGANVGFHLESVLGSADTVGSWNNAGLISGTGGTSAYGVYFENTGTVGTVTNSGIITGTGTAFFNIMTLTSFANSGTIQGDQAGFFTQGDISDFTNSGTIRASGTSASLALNVSNTRIGTLTNTGLMQSARPDGGATGFGVDYSQIDLLDNRGTITGQQGGIDDGGTITEITNSGVISATGGGYMAAGLRVQSELALLDNSGTISGTGAITASPSGVLLNAGVFNNDTILTLTNTGLIHSGAHGAAVLNGVVLLSGSMTLTGTIGTLTNEATGTISSTTGAGVEGGEIDTLINRGVISGGSAGGVNAWHIGTLNNSGTITGGIAAITAGSAGGIDTVTNSGSIGGGYYVIDVQGTIGSIANSGTISDGFFGIGIESGGSIGGINNSGTISAIVNAISNEGTLGTVTNSGVISGNIYSSSTADLAFVGPIGHTVTGTLTGGTVTNTASNVVFAGGNMLVQDSFNVGTYSVVNAGSNLWVNSTIAIEGNFRQTSGTLSLDNAALITVNGTASISGGDVNVILPSSGSYLAGATRTLISATSGSSYTGASVSAGLSGLVVSLDTASTDNLTLRYRNTYIGGAAGDVSNSGSISGVTTGFLVTSDGSIGTLTNTGTIGGSSYALSNAGAIATLNNSGAIADGTGLYNTGNIGTLTNSGLLEGDIGLLNTGTIAGLDNSGTITGPLYAISNAGSLGPVTNSGLISGNILNTASNNLTINGGSSTGTLSGGTITNTASDLVFASGSLALADAIDVGSHQAQNSGAHLILSSAVTITGNFSQNAGNLDLGSTGSLTVSGAAAVTGGTISAEISATGNYLVGGSYTLLHASAGSSYGGAAIAFSGATGLSAGIDTASTTDLKAVFSNYYVGDALADITNTGTVDTGYGVYVAATGNLDNLVNTGIMTGSSYAIYNLGALGPIDNSGVISGNIYSATALTVGASSAAGTLSGGTITAPSVTFTSGTIALQDAIVGDAANSGSDLLLSSLVSVSGAYTQTGGTLDLGASGRLNVGGAASISGGMITASLSSSGIYLVGQDRVLVDAATSSSYSGVTVEIPSVYGLSRSVDTSGEDVVIRFHNYYIGNSLSTLTNTGTISGVLDGVHVASSGTVGTLNNSGTLSGTHGISNDGGIGNLVNSGQITGSQWGLFNFSTGIGTISNSGVISGDEAGIYNMNTIVALNNTGTIGIRSVSDSSGIYNSNRINSINNDGVITGDVVALMNDGGTIGQLTNSGTIAALNAIHNTGEFGPIVNSGMISGNIVNASSNALTIAGGSGNAIGTLSGGTITSTAADVIFTAGNLALNDAVNVGTRTIINSGAHLIIGSGLSITGHYRQSAGILDLGAGGALTLSGTASFTGGTISAELPATGNYLVGGSRTLLHATAVSSYGSASIGFTGVTGLSASIDTTSTTDLIARYQNDYVGGSLVRLDNTGSIGAAYGVYVASTGNLSVLSNSGTIRGTSYAIYSAGILGAIANSGTIAGNIRASGALSLSGAGGSAYGTLTGGTISATSVTFTAGNLLLRDGIVANGGTVTNSGANLRIDAAQAITGNYMQTGGSLVVDVASTSSYGSLVVSGGANVTNSLITLSGSGLSYCQAYKVIDASAASSYTGDTVSAGSYYAMLSVIDNDLYVRLGYPFRDIGKNTGGDARVMGGVLEGLQGDPALQTLMAALSTATNAEIGAMLKQIAPAQVSSSQAILQRAMLTSTQIDAAIDSRSATARKNSPGWSLWGQMTGGLGERSAEGDVERLDLSSWGVVVGLDGTEQEWVYGAALSWNGGRNGGTGILSGNTNSVDSYQITAYGSWSNGEWTLNGLAGYGFDHFNHHRAIAVTSQTAQASFGGNHYEMAFDGSYAVPLGAVMLEPKMSLKWLHISRDRYSEEGAGGLNLTVRSAFEDQVESGLGLRLSSQYETGIGTLKPEVGLAWVHDFIGGASLTEATLAGVSFGTEVIRPKADALGVSAGVSLYGSDGMDVRVSYDGEFRDGYQTHSAQLQLSFGL